MFESENNDPEYARYEEDDIQYDPKPIHRVNYVQKAFDDEMSDNGRSEEERPQGGHRSGPKIIKFKQKKPSERQTSSSYQNESDENKSSDILDVYTPSKFQDVNNIGILRPYAQAEKPEFYQGPQWKFVRQSTNQNSKQKHYENGDYDKVQYGFPGAENEDKDGDGKLKLYPPIDDFSDEDLGIAPSSSNMHAKISFGMSPDSDKKNGMP